MSTPFRITWDQDHLTQAAMDDFVANTFNMGESARVWVREHQSFGCMVDDVDEILEAFCTTWTRRFCDAEEIPNSDPGDGRGSFMRISGPVLKVIVEPMCDTMKQFGQPTSANCDMLMVALRDDPLASLRAALGDDGIVAQGPEEILATLMSLMRDTSRDN